MKTIYKLIFLTLCFSFFANFFNNAKTTTTPSKATIQKAEHSYSEVFYSKLKIKWNNSTRIKGYVTKEKEVSKLKKHCKEQQVSYGLTVCFYYRTYKGLTDMVSTLPVARAIEWGDESNYFGRVDVSVNGKTISYYKNPKYKK